MLHNSLTSEVEIKLSVGCSSCSCVFIYDEERELFRFRDGRFAVSREHANWALLRKRGRLKEWE